MTVIYSNFGDMDTQLLQLIWEGLNPDRIIEITHDTEDYEDIVDEALMIENDTLIMCGHGTTQGLLHPNLNSGQYIIHENNVHLIHATWDLRYFERFGCTGEHTSLMATFEECQRERLCKDSIEILNIEIDKYKNH